jgi:CBS domain-containing protein
VSSSPRFSKRTSIAEVDHQLDIGPNVVHSSDDLLTVAHQAIGHPSTRVLAVVDSEERLVGILPVLRLVEEIVARAAPEDLLAEVTDLESAARFGRGVGARVAADLMSPPLWLTPQSSVADAFRAMKHGRYSGLPMIDEDGRVVGYIDLLELALAYLTDAESAAERPEPPQEPSG